MKMDYLYKNKRYVEYRKRKKTAFRKPYPMNLLLTINEERKCLGKQPILEEKITQDTIDGLLYVLTMLPDERAEEVIRLRFKERKTHSEIGSVFGIKGESVRLIISDSIKLINKPSLFCFLKNGKSSCETENGELYMPVKELGLPVAYANRLISAGCGTIKDVVTLTQDEIKNIYACGEVMRKEIASCLERIGITDSNWNKELN